MIEEFEKIEKENQTITEKEIKDFQSKYIDLYDKYKEIVNNNKI